MTDVTNPPERDWAYHHALRLREGLAFIVAQGRPVAKSEILAHLAEVDPPTEAERTIIPNGSERWANQFLWGSTGYVKAGLVTKSGTGFWTATEKAAVFLADYPEPGLLERELDQIYKAWLDDRTTQARRAWLIKGTAAHGANVVPFWFESDFVSLPATQLTTPPEGAKPSALKALVQECYAHLKVQQRKEKQDEIVAFVTQMQPGDVVITTHGSAIVVGDITGDWTWNPSIEGTMNLQRSVEWRNVDAPIEFENLPAPLPARLQTGRTLVDLTDDLDIIDSLAGAASEVAPSMPGSAEAPVPEVRASQLPMPSAEFAKSLLVGHEWLCEVVELLNERRQVIFYGPPGTGKTYIAQKLANHLVQLPQVKLVQFHPSYTYEDFFEGFRPSTGTTEGTLSFELRHGPLRRIVTRARENPEQNFVLIIDEINRANLAKVFGELYFLLEYRDQAVELLYSSDDESFTLPKNLYLIGTMNTADRSIALVDSAMRRRFAFVPLDPAVEPTKSMLGKWLKDEKLDVTAARLLELLNEQIDDPDFLVGPSYFMKSTDQSKEKLARMWRTTIVPLLEEHYFGRWDRERNRFAFDKLWARATSSSSIVNEIEPSEVTSVEATGSDDVGESVDEDESSVESSDT